MTRLNFKFITRTVRDQVVTRIGFKSKHVPGLGRDLAGAVVLAGEVGVLRRLVGAAEKRPATARRRWKFILCSPKECGKRLRELKLGPQNLCSCLFGQQRSQG